MGQKISEQKALDGKRAIEKFNAMREDKGESTLEPIEHGIVVFQNGNVLVEDKIMVHASPRQTTPWQTVEIFWEDKIESYRDLGLYGIYSTSYNEIKFEDDKLIIQGDNQIEIRISI